MFAEAILESDHTVTVDSVFGKWFLATLMETDLTNRKAKLDEFKVGFFCFKQ